MQLLIQSAIIFFGTLMAAAVVALGEPARAEVATAKTAAPQASQPIQQRPQRDESRVRLALTRSGFNVR